MTDKEPVISNQQALELVNRRPHISKQEKSMLRVWCFHNNPPDKLIIVVDSNYQYAYSEHGERLGLVDFWNCPEEDQLYFDGDNGILYTGCKVEGSALRFNASALEYSFKEIQKRKKNTIDLLGHS